MSGRLARDVLATSLLVVSTFPNGVDAGNCLADDNLELLFSGGDTLPREDSCCMFDICGLPCPAEVSSPHVGFGIVMACAIALSFVIGISTYFFIKGESENFFVAGRSLPLWIVAMTLAAQSIDSNSLLGNADLSYKYHFFDGAVLPIGLGLSLILNGIFLAHHVNKDNVLTLPDIFAKRYGVLVEILVSLSTIVSFMMLLAGNLVGMGAILGYLWKIDDAAAIWIAAGLVWAYTATGGLFSVAYTDVFQGLIGWTGCIVCAYYLIFNADPAAPPPSVGFSDYVYPPDGDACELYEGTDCSFSDGCCFNNEKWCENATEGCGIDNGAYPYGDQRVFSDQMRDGLALTPFPNAVFWNWATIFILAFGNLGALDFQARCMASKTPKIARLGCLIGGCLTFFVGIPFAYLGSITRTAYGPDSIHAEFEPDSCSEVLALPTCALWLPDASAFIKYLTHDAPAFLGAWCLFGIVAASMSTADGAILAMGTVFAHNVMRQFDSCFPNLITPKTLLLAARLSTIPFALAAALIAAYYRSSHSAGATGYLLIVAFDVVLATVVAPLFGAFYTSKPSPNAALISVLLGAFVRIVLEFALPKDGFLLLPFNAPEFMNVGPAASFNFPPFFDKNETELWDPAVEQCEQRQFEDYTGVDSLAAFFSSILAFVVVQFLERDGPLFTLPYTTPYDKAADEQEGKKEDTNVVYGKGIEKPALSETPKVDYPEAEETAAFDVSDAHIGEEVEA